MADREHATLGVSGGTVAQVSQRVGADRRDEADLAVKQGVWLGTAIALPLTALFVAYTAELVAVLGNDARTPMIVRGSGAVANVALNAVFIFGLGLGVAGAALGTLVATAAVTAAFVVGFLAGRLPWTGPFPLRLARAGPHVDGPLVRELASLSTPLMARWLATTLVVFPMLAIVATFGPVVVAAFEVARQIRYLMTAPNWGFSLAASSLVGQELGRDDPAEARAYGSDILRLSIVTFVLVSAAVTYYRFRSGAWLPRGGPDAPVPTD